MKIQNTIQALIDAGYQVTTEYGKIVEITKPPINLETKTKELTEEEETEVETLLKASTAV